LKKGLLRKKNKEKSFRGRVPPLIFFHHQHDNLYFLHYGSSLASVATSFDVAASGLDSPLEYANAAIPNAAAVPGLATPYASSIAASS
jgi:hypothetical protein